MNTLRMRRAEQADIHRLATLEEDAFSSDRITRRRWAALSHSPSVILLVAELDRQIVGSAVVLTRQRSRVARLYSIAVDTRWQRAGIGRALVVHSCRAARDRGCEEIRLESRIDNLQAHALFLALGFEPWGRGQERYYADGSNAIRFRLRHAALTHL